MRKTGLMTGALVVGLSAPAFGQSIVIETLDGDFDGAQLGRAVAALGDLNGDGRSEFIVGAPRTNFLYPGPGRAIVYSGIDRTVLFTHAGASSSDRYGNSVAGGGDLNDDGTPDYVVGAPDDDTNGVNAGKCVAFSGVDGSVLHTWYGDNAGDQFGESVAIAGDVNLDDFDDVVVGTPRFDGAGNSRGKAQVFSGETGAELHSVLGSDDWGYLGTTVAGLGDVDGDQYAEFVVGAPSASYRQGVVSVHSGVDGTVVRSHVGEWSPYGHDVVGELLGTSLACAGDVDDDGVLDIIAGGPDHGPYFGRARVFSGATGATLYTFDGVQMDDQMGRHVGAAGDVNDDGHADLIVGNTPWYISEPETVEIRSGADGSVLLSMTAEVMSEGFGAGIGTVGDISGDGVDDVALGVFAEDNGGFIDAGSVRLITGMTSSDLSDDYCFGDAATCPCGNGGLPGHGCDVPQGTGGFRLDVVNHVPDLTGGGTADLVGSGYPVMSQPGVTLIRSQAAPATPSIFGDGLLCLEPTSVVRINATLGMNGTSLNPVMHGAGAGTYFYQVWVRSTPIMFCDPAAAFNLSNGVSITWP